LAVGSILSSWLIPRISEKSEQKRFIQERRMSLALDIMKQSVIDDTQLNTLTTSFALFNKNAMSNPRLAGRLQIEQMSAFKAEYAQFDQHAWWWRHDLPTQSRLLQLPAKDEQTIQGWIDSYNDNLVKSTDLIEALRKQFLAGNYSPRNKHNTKLLDYTYQELTQKSLERGAIASQLAGKFMPPGVTW
jgi:hypothetical protein